MKPRKTDPSSSPAGTASSTKSICRATRGTIATRRHLSSSPATPSSSPKNTGKPSYGSRKRSSSWIRNLLRNPTWPTPWRTERWSSKRFSSEAIPANPGEDAPKVSPKVFDPRFRPMEASQGSGRLQLARWLIQPEHPLTARVMVNRVWHWHFGQGLVRDAGQLRSQRGSPDPPPTAGLSGPRVQGERLVPEIPPPFDHAVPHLPDGEFTLGVDGSNRSQEPLGVPFPQAGG